MLDVLKFLKKKDKPVEIKHLAVSIKGLVRWAKKNNKPLEDAFAKRDGLITKLIELIVKKNIPILTLYVLPKEGETNQEFDSATDSLIELFKKLANNDSIKENQIKVSVLGKWYGLPGMVVESIKSLIDKTKDYDNFFLNFCVNYDGKEEIIDAFRLIQRESMEKSEEDEEPLNQDLIKENTYSSYFIPPDLIIETGPDHNFSGVLLWDSSGAKMYFIEKLFPLIKIDDFEEIVEKAGTKKEEVKEEKALEEKDLSEKEEKEIKKEKEENPSEKEHPQVVDESNKENSNKSEIN
jgi:undecaprenyl diphosphate synthase